MTDTILESVDSIQQVRFFVDAAINLRRLIYLSKYTINMACVCVFLFIIYLFIFGVSKFHKRLIFCRLSRNQKQ